MSRFMVVRLGKDSVQDIKIIDKLHDIQNPPLNLKVKCKQVPNEATSGDYVWIWLGSDNSKGTPTSWKQGIRGFGRLLNKNGGPGYNDDWELTIEIKIVLQDSILSKDLLARASVAYYWCSSMPVLGLSTFSNQTAQLIKEDDPNQNIKALMYSVEAVYPGFRSQIENTYPELVSLFNYTPLSPITDKASQIVAPISKDISDESIPKSFPASWVIALASKGFLLISGPSGTGKSRTARDIARALDYTLPPEFAATVVSCRPANCLSFVSVGADWTDATPLLGFKNLFGTERKITDNAGNTISTNETWEAPSALRLLLRASYFPDQPHFLVLDEMNLSHVERYFGPFLSLVEANRGLDPSSKQLLLNTDEIKLIADTLETSDRHPLENKAAERLASRGAGLSIGDNIFIIGTVNVDETTYMFSPKVLDRAQVIEMLPPDPAKYLDNISENIEDIMTTEKAKATLKKAIERRRYGFWEREYPLEILKQGAEGTVWVDQYDQIYITLKRTLSGLQKILSPVGFSFAYRTVNEICAYLATYLEANDLTLFAKNDGIKGWQKALDRIIYQKILPRLHGNRRQLGESFRSLVEFLDGKPTSYNIATNLVQITDEEKLGFPLKLCSSKMQSMLLRLEATGHTTFVE